MTAEVNTPPTGAVYAMVEEFIQLLGQCPVSGDTKTDAILKKIWTLGLAEGFNVGLTATINQMRSPSARPMKDEQVMKKIVAPITTQGRDSEWARKSIDRLVAASWR